MCSTYSWILLHWHMTGHWHYTLIFLAGTLFCSSAYSQQARDSALYYLDLGQYSVAVPYFQESYDTLLQRGEWDTLTSLTVKYSTALLNTGDYSGSLNLISESYGLLEEMEGMDHLKVELLNAFAFSLHQMGQYESAQQILLEAQQLGESVFSEPHRLKAQTAEYLAMAYKELGDEDSLQYYVARAEILYLEVLDSTDKILGIFYNNVGVLLNESGDLDRSEFYYEKALNVLIPILGENHSIIGTIYNNLSSIYADRRAFRDAIAYSQKSIEIAQAADNPHRELQATYNKGSYLFIISEYDQGIPLLNRARELCTVHLGTDHIMMSHILDMLSEVTVQQQNYDLASNQALQSLQIKSSFYGDEHIEIARSYYALANVTQKAGNNEEALEYALKAIALRKKLLRPDHIDLAHSYHQAGDIYQQTGESHLAERMYRQALDIYQQNPYSHSWRLDTYTRLGDLYRHLGSYPASIKFYHEGLSALMIDPSASNPLQSDNLLFAPNLILCYQGLMQSHFLQYQLNPETHQDHLDSALYFIRLGTDQLIMETGQSFGEAAALIWSNYSTPFYGSAIQVAFAAYERTNKIQDIELGWEIINRIKYQALRQALQQQDATKYAGLPDSILESEKLLKSEISHLRSGNYANDTITSLQLSAKEIEYQKLLLELEQKYPRYHELKYNQSIPGLDEIQSATTDSTQLLQYLFGEGFFYVIGISQDSVFFVERETDGLAEIHSQVDSMLGAMQTQDCSTFSKHSLSLSESFLKPFLDSGKSDVIIIPHDFLYRINFEFLVGARGGEYCQFSELDFMIEKHLFRYLYLSEELLTSSTDSYEKDRILAVAPDFSHNNARNKHPDTASAEMSGNTRLSSLPWATRTVERIGQSFQGKTLQGSDATEENVKREIGRYRILHFGTHAEMNNSDPMLSRLFMQPSSSSHAEDGYLYTHEIYGLPMDASLVSLTACETGLGKLQNGEGMLSLARAFRYAGCPSVSMSLWKIDDQSSAEIMEMFYLNLEKGKTKDLALQDAKLAFLKNNPPEFANPLYWAGMIIIGDNTPLNLAGSSNVWVWAGIGCLILICFLFFRSRLKNSN